MTNQPQIDHEPMDAAGVNVGDMLAYIVERNQPLTEQKRLMDNARPAILAALAELQKADATCLFWREKLRATKYAEEVANSLTEEERKRLIKVRIMTMDDLERKQ